MKKITVSRLVLTIFICFGLVLLFSGCAKQPSETVVVEETAVAEVPVGAEEEPVMGAEPVLEEGESVIATVEELEVVEEAPAADYHVVKKGECLWWIAEYEDIYNDPFMWPLIYDANKDKIKNPNLIYPGQEFSIPRAGYSVDEVKEARRSAGAPRPYMPPDGAQAPMY
jgi:nucleoid-associated protein YgaU